MADKTDFTPELTLTPNLDAAAAAEAPQAPEAPALTLDPTGAVDAAAAQKAKDEQAIQLDESKLTEAERKMVDDFAKQIDLTDSNVVLQYGAAAQKNIAGFSESTLNSVRTKDLGEIGQALSSLVVELKGFGKEEDEKGIFGFFKKKKNELEAMKVASAAGGGQRGQDRRGAGGPSGDPDEGHRHAGPDVRAQHQVLQGVDHVYSGGQEAPEPGPRQQAGAAPPEGVHPAPRRTPRLTTTGTNMCSRFEKKLHDLGSPA